MSEETTNEIQEKVIPEEPKPVRLIDKKNNIDLIMFSTRRIFDFLEFHKDSHQTFKRVTEPGPNYGSVHMGSYMSGTVCPHYNKHNYPKKEALYDIFDSELNKDARKYLLDNRQVYSSSKSEGIQMASVELSEYAIAYDLYYRHKLNLDVEIPTFNVELNIKYHLPESPYSSKNNKFLNL